jgi:hypothetical protein
MMPSVGNVRFPKKKIFPARLGMSFFVRLSDVLFCYRISISCPNQSFRYKMNDSQTRLVVMEFVPS